MSKPRVAGQKASRSVDIASRALAEYEEAQKRREQWALEKAVHEVAEQQGWREKEEQ
jgi:hypothetical protein